MTGVIDCLHSFIKEGRKIAFLGVGSPLRADDSVGLFIVSEFQERLKSSPDKEFLFYLGESAPENFSGEIRNEAPSHLVIFDAAEMDKEPGSFSIIEKDQIGGTSFSTHMLPLKILVEYIIQTAGCRVMVIGVQPKSLDFAVPLSAEVMEAANQFVTNICKSIK